MKDDIPPASVFEWLFILLFFFVHELFFCSFANKTAMALGCVENIDNIIFSILNSHRLVTIENLIIISGDYDDVSNSIVCHRSSV